MNFRILDLFCGAGGFSYGLDQVKNFNTYIAVDFNKAALNTFSKNMPHVDTICGDITSDEIKNEIVDKAKELKINMIIGGPPCQGFSMKGKKLGLNDPRNFLFMEYYNLVKIIHPEVFIIENVKSIVTSEKGYFKDQILLLFRELGYHVDYKVLCANDYGVPQKRERAFFIGSLTKEIHFPMPTNTKTTVYDAISDLAYLSSGQGTFESTYEMCPTSEYQRKMRASSNKLYNHIATNHAPNVVKKLQLIAPECGKECLPPELLGKQKFASTWGRLKWNEPSPTIDTRFDTPSNGTNSHPYLDRAITAREAARIQSFPDTFVFYGNKSEICKQIGNAVPPLLAYEIGRNLQDMYKKRTQD